MKKIMVVTLPLGKNYGGILQAYALQKYLKDTIAAEVTTAYPASSSLRSALGYLKAKLKGLPRLTKKQSAILERNTSSFLIRTMNTIVIEQNSISKNSKTAAGYDCFVVGSDQVWRGAIGLFMLDFVPSDRTKISYAASFGVERPEASTAVIEKAGRLVRSFAGVSVREDSGVEVVRDMWGVDAEHHIDPTLLLSEEDYLKLIEDCPDPLTDQAGKIFEYVLDGSEEKYHIKNFVRRKMGLDGFTVIDKDLNSGQPMPPVEQWVKSFDDAQFVVTDSFHGTVFAIIFNKPFIAIGNKSRGMARFTSLLTMFGLQDRLVASAEEVTDELLSREIDWAQVNAKIKAEQGRALEYLRAHLT